MPTDRSETGRHAPRPFLSFYGSKWRMASHLPAPRYPVIIEPFAGSLGYSVRHGSGGRVLGVERDPVIASVWRWLLTATPDDVRALPLLGADDDLREMPHLDPAARALIGFWLNAGASAPGNRPSRWMRESMAGRTLKFGWGEGIRERIARQLELIADWVVVEGDYTYAPDVEATWLIDPPYQQAGRHYRHGSDDIDYSALGEWCRSRRGQVIVCEHTSADWLPFTPVPFSVKATTKGGLARYSPEAIWTNTP